MTVLPTGDPIVAAAHPRARAAPVDDPPRPAWLARAAHGSQFFVRWSLGAAALISLLLVANIELVGRLLHWSAQTREFDQFRKELAFGTAPVGAVNRAGRLLRLGTPVAFLQIPSLHLREVVGEGTTGAVLISGPGHLRSTVLPGQQGTSVVFGRAAAYGGPFEGLSHLKVGATIVVTTGVGVSRFRVIDVRRAGDPLPPTLASDAARLTLVTATGPPLLPSGVVRVDADGVGRAEAASPLVMTSVPRSEQPMGSDTGGLWRLVLLLQASIALVAVAVWSWARFGGIRTWIAFVPCAMLLSLLATSEVTRLLPNLL